MSAKKNSWGFNGQGEFRYPKLTEKELTLLQNFDREPHTVRHARTPLAHQGLSPNVAGNEHPFRAGAPIKIVASAGPKIVRLIRFFLDPERFPTKSKTITTKKPLNRAEIIEVFDLRPEWVDEIMEGKKDSYVW